MDVGGLTATATEHKTVPLARMIGVGALIAGIALVIAPKRRAA